MTDSVIGNTVPDMTPTQQLATMLLGQSVIDWVAQRRDAGRTWRHVARDLYEQTNGQIDVTYETLRSWMDAAA